MDTRRPTKFSVLQIVIEYLSVSAFLPPAINPSRYRAFVFLAIKNVETLQCISWYCAAFDYMRVFFPKLSSIVVTKKAITGTSSGLGMSLCSAMKEEIIHRGFAILLSWKETSALPEEVLTKLNSLSTFPTKSFLELFCLI